MLIPGIRNISMNWKTSLTLQMNANWFFVALVAIVFAGCGGSKEAEKSNADVAVAEMRKYEADFHPSDYDMDVKVFLSELTKEKDHKTVTTEPSTVEPPVVVPGYRVQLLATPEIDEANTKKTEAETAFPDQWFYLVYDPPVYKLRAGNFLSRSDADAYARYLSDHGYPDAWIVPERVVKNIQPRVPPPPQEESKQ